MCKITCKFFSLELELGERCVKLRVNFCDKFTQICSENFFDCSHFITNLHKITQIYHKFRSARKMSGFYENEPYLHVLGELLFCVKNTQFCDNLSQKSEQLKNERDFFEIFEILIGYYFCDIYLYFTCILLTNLL